MRRSIALLALFALLATTSLAQEAPATKVTAASPAAAAKQSTAAAAAAAPEEERVPAKAARATASAAAAAAADSAADSAAGPAAAAPKRKQQKSPVRLCAYGSGIDADACAAAVEAAFSSSPPSSPPAESPPEPAPAFSCVALPSARACAAAVARGDADVVRLGSDDTHAARSRHGLAPVAAEDYGSGDATSYWSVAVVPAALCGSGGSGGSGGGGGKLALADLAGARLCSTGYRKGAGWTAPVGTMMAAGALSAKKNGGAAPPGVAGDAAAVAGFFGKVCAPRRTSSGPRAVVVVGGGNGSAGGGGGGGGSLWPEGLCDGCLSQEEQDALPLAGGGKRRAFCEENAPESAPRPGGSDAWSGYSGAIDCLLASLSSSPSPSSPSSSPSIPRVVMFNKADAKAGDGTKLADLAAAPQLRLLCPATAQCAPLSDYRNCNLGRVRAHALMGRPAWAASADGAAAARALAALGGDAVARLSKGAAPFFSGDARAVVDCEEGGGRCRSDYNSWFGLTRAYDALGGVGGVGGGGSGGEGAAQQRASVLASSAAGGGGGGSALSPGAIAAIVVGSLLGTLAVASVGVAVGRRIARRGSGSKAFVPSSSSGF